MLRLSHRGAVYTLFFLALLAWGGVIAFTRYIPPSTVLAFAGFFLLLGLAMTCTLSPIAYVIGRRLLSSKLYRATMRNSMRQGFLLSLCIVLNLLLRALRSWNIFTAIIIFVAAIIIEVVSLARKEGP